MDASSGLGVRQIATHVPPRATSLTLLHHGAVTTTRFAHMISVGLPVTLTTPP